MSYNNNFEVLIIGGSYAGLSAAMALGRSLRRVLIIDSGLPCNRQTPHSHNFITHDGEKPITIATKAKEQVLRYDTVSFLKDLAVSGSKIQGGFSITTAQNKTFSARKLIFATGIKDEMPDIKGFTACWGISVIHCPYCHGYEFKGQKIAIMANGERAMHISSLVRNLTDDITILTYGKANFSVAEEKKLRQHHINIIETGIGEIKHEQGYLKEVVLSDGLVMNFKAMYAVIPFTQHCTIPAALGCELTEQGHIKTDLFQKTTMEGIYACGDNTSMMRSVAYSVASGNITGAMVNKELVDETF